MSIYLSIYLSIYIYIYMCVCVCLYVFVCLCVYMCVYEHVCVCNNENNVPSRLSPQCLCLWQLMHLGTSVNHVPKCMSCHKAVVVITGRVHWFHDYIYITPILLL